MKSRTHVKKLNFFFLFFKVVYHLLRCWEGVRDLGWATLAQFSRLTFTGVQLKKHGFFMMDTSNKHKSRRHSVIYLLPIFRLLHGYSYLGYSPLDDFENDLQW